MPTYNFDGGPLDRGNRKEVNEPIPDEYARQRLLDAELIAAYMGAEANEKPDTTTDRIVDRLTENFFQTQAQQIAFSEKLIASFSSGGYAQQTEQRRLDELRAKKPDDDPFIKETIEAAQDKELFRKVKFAEQILTRDALTKNRIPTFFDQRVRDIDVSFGAKKMTQQQENLPKN